MTSSINSNPISVRLFNRQEALPSGRKLLLNGKMALASRIAFVTLATALTIAAAVQLSALAAVVVGTSSVVIGFGLWKLTQKAVNRMLFVKIMGGAESFDARPCYDGPSFTVTEFGYWEQVRERARAENLPARPEDWKLNVWKIASSLIPNQLKCPLSIAQLEDGRLIAVMRGIYRNAPHRPPYDETVELLSEDGGCSLRVVESIDSFYAFPTIDVIPLLNTLFWTGCSPAECHNHMGTTHPVAGVRGNYATVGV